MSPNKVTVTDVKDDPTRPFKLYAGLAVGIITAILASGVFDANQKVTSALTILLTVLAVFVTPNPKVRK